LIFCLSIKAFTSIIRLLNITPFVGNIDKTSLRS
jgi:hypothetical protein